MRSPVYPAEYDLMGTQREGSSGAAAGGGRSEVKRSRAGSPHGEPRTEPPLLRRRRRTGVPAWRAPHSRTNYTPWGTPAVGRTGGAPLPDELHSLGYPRRRENGGHNSWTFRPC